MTPKPPLTAAQITIIACCALATYLGASMGSAVSLVLPHIAADLHASATQVQWVMASFLLSRIAFLRPAGMLCDALGARRIFLLGIAGFSVSSFLCMLAGDESLLIVFRILQGLFAALLSPSALVLLRRGVPPERQAFAMSIWSAAGVAGFALSPVLGGLLVNAWGWRSMFEFTAALAALIGLAMLSLVREPRRSGLKTRPQDLPILDEVCSAAALAVLAFFVGRNDVVAVLGMVSAVVAVLALLTRRGVFRAEAWRLGLSIVPQVGIGLAGFMAIAGGMLWASYFIQTDLRHIALVFGLGCLPMAVTGMAACFATAPLLSARRSTQVFMTAGLCVVALGFSAYLAEREQSLILAVTALACAGACYGFANAAVTSGVIECFPANRSGNASTIATLSKQFGQLIGISVVASFRDLSGARGGDDHRLFYFFVGSGVLLLVCAGLGAMLRRRQRATLAAVGSHDSP